jgi:tetratricopeptide (TPR) repeat protein/tRNA A-37 threonylcarbamoyl transferase component Bud32
VSEPRDPSTDAASRAGRRRIGERYELGEVIGRGGMATIHRATDIRLEREVAVKLLKPEVTADPDLAQRFRREALAATVLRHPNIVACLDTGTDGDQPYLVMELVDGEDLAARLRRGGRLAPWAAARIGLDVARALGVAHVRGIVHRDIKPGNILVDSRGQPILLDFGTARLLEPESESGTTATVMPVITARYASPEQVDGRAGSIRSDVYSLAVILYELMTDQWPYEGESGTVSSVLRAVAEQQPIRPSRRCVDATSRKFLAGDLDAILVKALDKQSERRYGSVLQFAGDLRKRLDNQPVEARNPTNLYRTRLFLRRHRVGAAAAVLFVSGLTASTAYSFRQARVADRERAKAVHVVMFLEQLLGASPKGGISALVTGGRELKVVDVIEQAAARVGEEFKNSPDIEVGLRTTISSALMALGDREKATPHVARAVELAERLYGDDNVVTARTLTARGRLRMAAGDYKGAQSDLHRSLAWYASVRHPEIAFQHSLLGEAYYRQADLTSARGQFEEALRAMRAKFGDHHVTTATMISNVGVVTDDAGDAVAAEKYFEAAASVLRALPGPPGNLVHPLIGLSRSHFFRREYDKAGALANEAHQHALKTAGPRHPNTTVPALQLALIRAHQGDASAEMAARATVSLLRSLFPANHIEISRGLTTLGRILILRGKSSEAIHLLREAYDIARSVFPKQNWRPAESQIFIGAALAMAGKTAEAQQILDGALSEMSAVLPESHPRVVEASQIRTRCLAPLTARPCTL